MLPLESNPRISPLGWIVVLQVLPVLLFQPFTQAPPSGIGIVLYELPLSGSYEKSAKAGLLIASNAANDPTISLLVTLLQHLSSY